MVGQIPRGDNFFQREPLLKKLYQRLDNHAHLYMAAPRRMGKTAIMRYLEDNPMKDYCPVYVITESIDSSELFFKVILEALFKNQALKEFKNLLEPLKQFLSKHFKKISAFGVNLELKNPENSYYQKLQTLLKEIHNKPELKLVIMLDEFPQTIINISRKHSEMEAVKFLQMNREMRQQANETISFMITGSIGLPVLAEKLKATKTVNDLNVFELPPLSFEEAQELLGQLLEEGNLPYQDSNLKQILDKLEWFSPYHIQLLAQKFIDQYDLQRTMINPQSIDEAFQAVTHWRNDINFSHYYSRLEDSFVDQELAFALAVLKILSQQTLLTSVEMAQLASEQALVKYSFILRSLEFDGYIFKSEQGWRFTSPILKLWWHQYVNG